MGRLVRIVCTNIPARLLSTFCGKKRPLERPNFKSKKFLEVNHNG